MAANFLESAQPWLDAGLGFFYPEVCQHCGEERATREQGYIGEACRETIRFITRPFCERCGLPFEGEITTTFECANCREMELHFCHARSAVAARGLMLELIHRYKYQRALWLEPLLGEMFTRVAAPELRRADWDMIVPVPLHPVKQREREFNQAERLARRLGAATGIPVQTRVLRRVAPTQTQTLLSREKRAANVRRAFACRRAFLLARRRVVVVDDVLTTGATTSACAKTLCDRGAEKVCVWTLARGLMR